jgi:hypothetical protein
MVRSSGWMMAIRRTRRLLSIARRGLPRKRKPGGGEVPNGFGKMGRLALVTGLVGRPPRGYNPPGDDPDPERSREEFS